MNSSVHRTIYFYLSLVPCLYCLGSCGSSTHPTVDAGRDAASSLDSAVCPASCDDNQSCTDDTCDTTTFQCVHTPLPDGTSCQGTSCAVNSICQGGVCKDGLWKTCVASDQCHVAGGCDPRNGECSNPPAPNGKGCDDGTRCTLGDQCSAGVCAGTTLQCSKGAYCDEDAGACRNVDGSPGFPSALLGRSIVNLFGVVNGNSLAASPGGKVYLAGTVGGASDLGSGPLPTDPNLPIGSVSNPWDLIVAQIDPASGAATWVKIYVGQQAQRPTSFGLNGNGQVGITGLFQGDFEDNGQPQLLALKPRDQFIIGTNAVDGKWLWGRRVNLEGLSGQSQWTGLSGLAGDPAGSAFILCGTATKDATELDNTPDHEFNLNLKWQGGSDAVVAALDGGTSSTLWALQLGGGNDDTCSAVTVDATSNVYVAGTYGWGSVITLARADGTTIRLDDVVGVGGSWMFVAKFSITGQPIWAKGFGGTGETVYASSILAVGGDLVVAGRAEGKEIAGKALDAGSAGANKIGGKDLGSPTFLMRLSGADGSTLWQEGIGPGSNVVVKAMTEASQDRILMAGDYSQAGQFGPYPLPAPFLGKPGALVAQFLATDGTMLIAKGYGSPTSGSDSVGIWATPNATDADQETSLLLTSFDHAQMDFGPPLGAISSSNGADSALALVKLAP